MKTNCDPRTTKTGGSGLCNVLLTLKLLDRWMRCIASAHRANAQKRRRGRHATSVVPRPRPRSGAFVSFNLNTKGEFAYLHLCRVHLRSDRVCLLQTVTARFLLRMVPPFASPEVSTRALPVLVQSINHLQANGPVGQQGRACAPRSPRSLTYSICT